MPKTNPAKTSRRTVASRGASNISQGEEEKNTGKLIIIVVIVLALLGAPIIWFVVGRSDSEESAEEESSDVPSNIRIIDEDEGSDSPDVEESEPDVSENEEPDTLENDVYDDDDFGGNDFSSGDFSNYSQENQSVGDNRSGKISINSVNDSTQGSFHKITFQVEVEDGDSPMATATYKSNLGAIRLVFEKVKADSSGIAYQASKDISKEGVVKIYHNISAEQTEELYDIGVENPADFYLYSENTSGNMWNVILEVRYPGEAETVVDSGAGEFGTSPQSLSGASSSDGATVSGYNYGASNGVLRFVLDVKGSSSKPIPAVTAEYDSSGDLVVTFPSLVKDFVGDDPGSQDLYGGVDSVHWERVGQKTIFTFDITGGKKDFKLSASTSPNQVVVEIRL